MFCMELALRALYWSGYVYDYDEVRRVLEFTIIGARLWGNGGDA